MGTEQPGDGLHPLQPDLGPRHSEADADLGALGNQLEGFAESVGDVAALPVPAVVAHRFAEEAAGNSDPDPRSCGVPLPGLQRRALSSCRHVHSRASCRAAAKISWNIGRVNLPVKVFCWLG